MVIGDDEVGLDGSTSFSLLQTERLRRPGTHLSLIAAVVCKHAIISRVESS